jgi:hypothetical protein
MKIITCLIVALMTISTHLYAGTDWKTYSATGCVPDGKRKAGSNIIRYDGFGGICNLSGEKSVDIVCPVIRDYSSSHMPVRFRHSGRSGNPDADLVCTYRNMRTQASDSGSSMASQFATLTPIKLANNNRFAIRHAVTEIPVQPRKFLTDYGASILTCRLPQSDYTVDGRAVTSCLYNYSIREWDGND